MSTPLIIDDEVKNQVKSLVELAEANPVQMAGFTKRLEKPENKTRHIAQMTRQTIQIPLAFMVTYSIELGHPCGKCRHISISVHREGRVVNTIGAWMIAREFGFWGDLCECNGYWWEDLQGHGKALNLVQRYEVFSERR